MGEIKKRTDLEMALELTLVAIREDLMEYFKGSCVERMVDSTNVRIVRDMEPSQYTYQRNEQEWRKKSHIQVGPTTILMVEKNPHRIIYRANLLRRSPEFRTIRKEVERFANKYLRAVQQVDKRSGSSAKQDDSSLILQNLPGNRPETAIDEALRFYTEEASIWGRADQPDGTVQIRWERVNGRPHPVLVTDEPATTNEVSEDMPF